MEDRISDDGLLFMSEEDFVVDFSSNGLDSLPWNATYDTNDAAFADVHQETTFTVTVDSVNTSSLDIYSDHINPILYNTQELPALDTTYLDILPTNWDFMVMPTEPITTTLAGSITTTEQSNYSADYTSSSSPMTQRSPTGLTQSQISNPLRTKSAENAPSTTTRRRKTKMEPGTRPCDLKRQKRKEDKPEKCRICGKGHQWNRDLERHYWSNHPDEAAKMGLSRKQQNDEDSGTGNRTLGSAALIPQLKMRARNISHYTIPDEKAHDI
ncbi:zinc finger MSN2 [Fusarium tjaetaba]|uniref:Zinc finger MSN2 n=1 Tax=Fusarium tjaetaba TaxID=1567544 RepID=A0A8H5QFH3_9HYPO|nr:zinc finger MSN2 [Fusarium tjaetaba]KAF5614921.1 zinc finger MSN2 [Fusarium tjaetaba]